MLCMYVFTHSTYSTFVVWTPWIGCTRSVQPPPYHCAHATCWQFCLRGGKTHRVIKTRVLCSWAVGRNLQWTVKPQETLKSLCCFNERPPPDNARWKQQENNEERKSKSCFCLIKSWGQRIHLNGFATHHTQQQIHRQHTRAHTNSPVYTYISAYC